MILSLSWSVCMFVTLEVNVVYVLRLQVINSVILQLVTIHVIHVWKKALCFFFFFVLAMFILLCY